LGTHGRDQGPQRKKAHFFLLGFWIDLDFPTVVFREEGSKSTMLFLVLEHRMIRPVRSFA
jgi:hypothetical protein